MATRSTIRIKRIDGTETGIYCHFDGYIEGVGVTLQLAYNTAEKVEKLLKLGDLSTLGYYTEPDPEKPHSFDGETQESVCVAYHRDRGEKFCQSNVKNEYVYTFNEREAVWYVEEENFISDTPAMQALGINYVISYPNRLLLDAIAEKDFRSQWTDDEFATKGTVYEACERKALEARQEILEEQRREHEAYYRAYCD